MGVRPDRAVGPARRAVPGHLAVGGGRLRRYPGRAAAGTVPARAGRTVPRGGAGAGGRLLRHQGAQGDDAPGTRGGAAAARGRDRRAGPGAGGRLDRHRVAGHDGGSRAERTERDARTAPEPERPGAALGSRPAGGRRIPGGRQRQHRGTGMTAVMPAGVATARDLVGPAMAAAVARLSPEVRTVAAYHLGLAGLNGHAAATAPAAAGTGVSAPPPADGRAAGGPQPAGAKPGGSGKALRPALALLSARAALAAPERGVPAAVAVELVHNFSLLHDDIMDGDTERRHRPTAWTVYGVGAAILAGDAMLALAQDILLE